MALTSKLSRLVAGVQRQVDLSANTLVVQDIQIGATLLTQASLDALLAGSDGKVKVSATDTTTNYLSTALVPGSALISTILNPGADEYLSLDVAVDGSTIEVFSDALRVKALGITSAQLDTNAVTSSKIDSGAVTGTKIASGAVDDTKLFPDAVTTSKIAAAAVTDAKIATGIDAAKLADGSVSNAEFQYINSLTSNAQTQLTDNATAISDHLSDAVDAHDASAISSVAAGNLAATDVQAALNELDGDKVAKSGDTMSGNLAMGSNKVTGLAAGSNPGDAVNKAQLDGVSAGALWLNPIIDPNLINDSLSTPPGSPVTGNTYIAGASATGAWATFDGYAFMWDGSAWVDLLGRAVIAGDRFGVSMESATAGAGGLASKDDQIAQVLVATPGSVTYTFTIPAVSNAVYINNGLSYHTGHQYDYTGSGWVEFGGLNAVSAGNGLAYAGNVLSVNMGAGIATMPSDEVGIDVHTSGGLMTTVDNSASSTLTNAQLAVKLDGSTLSKSASGVKVAAGGITDTEVSASAAIAYSKLNLSASIVNADVASGAAIAYSKLALSNSIVAGDLTSSSVTTAKIAAAAVDETKLAASVAGDGLAGGAGLALSVNVDASTIEISANALRVKDAGITAAKLAADVTLHAIYKNDADGSGATITTDATDGDVIVAGTQKLSVTADLGLSVSRVIDIAANVDATTGVITQGGQLLLYSKGTGGSKSFFLGTTYNTTMTGSSNMGMGGSSLQFLTTGANNAAIGRSTLRNTTTGSNNAAIGRNALEGTTIGSSNTGTGFSAGSSNSTGTGNTYLGDSTGASSGTGSNNTFVGRLSVTDVLAAYDGSTALGYQATITASNQMVLGSAAVTDHKIRGVSYAFPTSQGAASTFLQNDGSGTLSWAAAAAGATTLQDAYANDVDGSGATITTDATDGDIVIAGTEKFSVTADAGLSVSRVIEIAASTDASHGVITQAGSRLLHTYAGTFLGSGAGNFTSTGANNIGIGNGALSANTTGENNIAIGTQALQANTTGIDNIASGTYALQSNTTGYSNVASGTYALQFNTTGSDNIASGFGALNNNTTGSNNIASGSVALYSNTTGSNNVASGSYALQFNTTGENNIAVGTQALQFNTTGGGNIATGTQALLANTTGSSNIASGTYALQSNTTGENNIASGFQALNQNTTGSNNIASGTQALQFNTTGENNIASGTYALQANTTGSSNIASGTSALQANTTGIQNIASGFGALQLNLTGSNNVASGYLALNNNTTGSNNIAVGVQALQANSSGGGNIATGTYALNQNTTGENNIASGTYALNANTTGSYNIAVGMQALQVNTTGEKNIASGSYALQFNTTGSNNIASGFGALNQNTTGSNNIALGSSALIANTTGNNNIATGIQALQFNTTGSDNTASGFVALQLNTTGYSNVASGISALNANTTGAQNTATGREALYSNTTGHSNVASGYRALFLSVSGDNNTAVGFQAGLTVTTGSNNVFLGTGADTTLTYSAGSTAIGYNAVVSASDAIILGTAVNKVGINGVTAPTAAFDMGGFKVDSTGDIVEIKAVTYAFPASQGAASTFLQNDGSGTLSWAAAAASGIATATKTAAYTVVLTDGLILADATSAAFTVTLPTAASAVGKRFDIKKIDAGLNIVTVQANGAELIDGVNTQTTAVQYQSFSVVSDGTQWWIV